MNFLSCTYNMTGRLKIASLLSFRLFRIKCFLMSKSIQQSPKRRHSGRNCRNDGYRKHLPGFDISMRNISQSVAFHEALLNDAGVQGLPCDGMCRQGKPCTPGVSSIITEFVCITFNRTPFRE